MPTGARLARTPDADAIAHIQLRAWRAHYAEVLPAEVLDGLDARALADAWGESILRPPTPLHLVLVATSADDAGRDTVVGYAAIAPAEGSDPGIGELLDLVIDPDATGAGHGSRLMAAAIDHLRGAGAHTAVIWIPVADDPRRRFLESAGWGVDGAFRDLDAGPSTMRQIRLVTDIDENNPGPDERPAGA